MVRKSGKMTLYSMGNIRLLSDIIFADSCVNTIQEFGSYIWDEAAAAHGEDRPVKEHDHAMDALRYFVYTILNNQTAIIRSKQKAGFH